MEALKWLWPLNTTIALSPLLHCSRHYYIILLAHTPPPGLQTAATIVSWETNGMVFNSIIKLILKTFTLSSVSMYKLIPPCVGLWGQLISWWGQIFFSLPLVNFCYIVHFMLLWNTHYINKQERASTAYHVSHMSNATGRMIVERIWAIPRSGQQGKTVATRQSSLVKSVPSSWYTHNLWWLRKLLVASGGCIRAYVLICFWSGVVSAGAHNPGYTAGTFLPRPWPVNTR